MRVFVSTLVAMQPALIAWLCGFDFDQRSFWAGYVYLCAILFGGMAWTFPGWKK